MRLYVGGTFDLFHPGHVRLLERCKAFGEVVVSLNTDEFAERYKRRPIMSFEERRSMLEACIYVDEVIVNEGDEDSRPAILASGATHVVHGDDWTGDALMEQMGFGMDWLKEMDLTLLYLPYTEGISTRELIERCRSQP